MNTHEASDLTIVLRWAMGQGDALGTPYPAEQATLCARRLAERARKVLPSGLRPLEVELIGGGLVPRDPAAPGWIVEGVLLCPDCTLYLDFEGTPEDLQKAIAEHEGLDH